jgi:antibiotic biosynthesis monooxygenase (ABM) superfamily enzyme
MDSQIQQSEEKFHYIQIEERKTLPSKNANTFASSNSSRSASILASVKLLSMNHWNEYRKIVTEMEEFCHLNYNGHIYSRILEPEKNGNVTALHRFDSMQSLKIWADSEDRKKFLERIKPLIVPDSLNVEIVEGATQWIEVATETNSSKKGLDPVPPPLWKISLVIVTAIYPQVIILAYTLMPHLIAQGYSPLTRTAIVLSIVLPIAFYILLPILFRLLEKWLTLPRPKFPRHSFLNLVYNGFSVFQPANPYAVNPVQESVINRINAAEKMISNLQDKLRKHERDFKGIEIASPLSRKELLVRDKIEETIVRKLDREYMRNPNEDEQVSAKIVVKVPNSYARTYENFGEDLGMTASKFEGFKGIDIIKPSHWDENGYGIYKINMRFQKQSQLRNFIHSPERKQLRTAINPISIFIEADVEKDRVVLLAGFENLFTNNSANIDPTNVPIPPPKWKTLLVIYLILICNSIFWGTFISPLYMDSVPFPLFILISLFMDIVLTSYFSSPLMNKLLQDWLHSHTQKDIPTSYIGKCLHLGLPGLRF